MCEGGCQPHQDGLTVVRVVDWSGIVEHDWGYYAYCPAAIKEDKARGFHVLTEGDQGFEPDNSNTVVHQPETPIENP